jgi:hypothetical protein
VDPREEFCSRFALLTGHAPFPWQQKLFDALLEARFPEALDIPTGLGKTSVIAIWLLALAQHAHTRTTTSRRGHRRRSCESSDAAHDEDRPPDAAPRRPSRALPLGVA